MRTISTHAPRTGSDYIAALVVSLVRISTHAPRTGSDDAAGRRAFWLPHFNPRSPHGERRHHAQEWIKSTINFNPCSPHGERPGESSISSQLSQFQPTLPARGATESRGTSTVCITQFQPTLPARGATVPQLDIVQIPLISTHAPRTGSDDISRPAPSADQHHISTHAPRTGSDLIQHPERRPQRFQPTLPARGATATRDGRARKKIKFQPTLPARGATSADGHGSRKAIISTHAPRTGSDALMALVERLKIRLFQPTLPARGATVRRQPLRRVLRISTHAPRTGSDTTSHDGKRVKIAFQPTLPARGATGHRRAVH